MQNPEWRKLCHDQRYLSTDARFEQKIDTSGDCHIWIGCKDKDGYGLFRMNGKNIRAHRFQLERKGVFVPKNLQVLHRCDNPSCVNPEHLWIGTNSENQIDSAIKFRNGSQKLTVEKVVQLKARRLSGESCVSLSKEYGIHPTTVTNIMKGRKWKHV